ncbi:MAG: T9SS type A sorting domain-containing protein [Tannerellaceae bacterium]|jgi:hypothetical protein|nr:T9SS type A sorting domain-containing protein [Tannerellaceae bacterium]
MRRYNITYILLVVFAVSIQSQVSHGGGPLPAVMTRSYQHNLFEEMPSFDLESELRIEDPSSEGLRGGYRFAYKFITDFNRNNSGTSFTLPDGRRVWRLGIRSHGALSINVLFTEYELPEGAQVFLYNSSRTHVLGAFNHLNNSTMGLLPVSPVEGDELIVEYIEPAVPAFSGRLTIGEVNHGYRPLLKGYEPGDNRSDYACMASPACFGEDREYALISRSVVLLTIDGVTACTGVMVNNTLNDGKPYLLTASHCLNKNFGVTSPDYEAVAGRIVCFFNYTSPTCDSLIRGTEEMSVSSAIYRAVNEKSDMALLELAEAPPAYYQPYYAGWTIEERGDKPPYAGIHHPRASVKRINICEDRLRMRTFSIKEMDFYSNSHWNVALWSEGSTDGGSSGSPLFDSSHRLTGYLSGGASTCFAPEDDYYVAFSKAWAPSDNASEQLKIWLDPAGNGSQTLDGLDPYDINPCYRLSNIGDRKLQDSISNTRLSAPASGNLFGINSLQTTEYAEGYHTQGSAWIDGVYLVTPAIDDAPGSLEVEIRLYEGNGSPRTLLHSETFNPVYRELSLIDSTFIDTKKRLGRAQESFVRFSRPVHVPSGVFYAGYKIKSAANSSFAVYNLSKGLASGNTAWINNKGSWIQASAHPLDPFATSLFIDPVVRYSNDSSSEAAQREDVRVWVDTSRKQIHIRLSYADNNVCRIYSTGGQLLQENTINASESIISAYSLNSGVYILQIRRNHSSYAQKIFL